MSAVLVASIFGADDIETTVGSSTKFPSVSSPSSLTSLTSPSKPWLEAKTWTELITSDVIAADFSIM